MYNRFKLVRVTLLVSILVISLFISPSIFANKQLTLSSEAQSAHALCPTDTVVWLNTKSGIWHFEGSRWYGNTKQGAYVCEKEAKADGDRASKNG